MLTIETHPLLDLRAFVTELPQPLGALASPDWLQALLTLDVEAPLQAGDEVRAKVRDLLRHGGYKPTGRGKPASEYLRKVAAEGLRSINLAVDACNAVSLHSGVPISVVDLDRATPPLRVGIAGEESYVFNPAGQTIDVKGLLCLFDAAGPCANAVKDAQRTKTDESTTRTLSLLWGTQELGDLTARACDWYMSLLREAGATTELALQSD